MKLFVLAALLFNSIECTTTTVYICDSPQTVKYHYKANCRGLSNCKFRIIRITLDSAERSNKTLCNWEKNTKVLNQP